MRRTDFYHITDIAWFPPASALLQMLIWSQQKRVHSRECQALNEEGVDINQKIFIGFLCITCT